MNWTAWNSLVAKALRKRPSATPSSALPTASATTRAGEPERVDAEQAEGDRGGDAGLHRGDERERDRVAGDQVELGERE